MLLRLNFCLASVEIKPLVVRVEQSQESGIEKIALVFKEKSMTLVLNSSRFWNRHEIGVFEADLNDDAKSWRELVKQIDQRMNRAPSHGVWGRTPHEAQVFIGDRSIGASSQYHEGLLAIINAATEYPSWKRIDGVSLKKERDQILEMPSGRSVACEKRETFARCSVAGKGIVYFDYHK